MTPGSENLSCHYVASLFFFFFFRPAASAASAASMGGDLCAHDMTCMYRQSCKKKYWKFLSLSTLEPYVS